MGLGVLLEEDGVPVQLRSCAVLSYDEFCDDLILSVCGRHEHLHIRRRVKRDGDSGARLLVVGNDM